MSKYIKNIISIGLFSLLYSFLYINIKQVMIKLNTENFIENSNVLGMYTTTSDVNINYLNLFLIVFFLSILYYFISSVLISFILKINFLDIFNIISNNIILIIGIIISFFFLNSLYLAYIILIICLIFYLKFIFDNLNLSIKNKVLCLFIIIILLFFELLIINIA